MRLALLATAALVLAAVAVPADATDHGLYPDLQTVVPKHLGIQNQQQREILRFSNGIANTGDGDLRMRPDVPPRSTADVTNAIQEILGADGNVAHETIVSTYEYHATHNHWHIGDVARFELRHALDDGTGGAMGAVLVNDRGVAQSTKYTFCLIDWYKLSGNSPANERVYFDCAGSHQGISPGWVDQYHQSTDGQQIDLTGAPAGRYYLVSTANPEGTFLESDTANNAAWTSFSLTRDSKGNPKLAEIAHSACSSAGLCGEVSANR